MLHLFNESFDKLIHAPVFTDDTGKEIRIGQEDRAEIRRGNRW